MAQIVPAILSKSFEEIEEKVSLVFRDVDTISIDIVDGEFAPTRTWPFEGADKYAFQNMIDGEQKLPHYEKISYEIDMMVYDPMKYIEDWIKIGSESFVIHYGSVGDKIEEVISFVKQKNKSVGVALKPSEDVGVLENFISKIDFIQLMGNDNIGQSGVALDEKVFEKIRTVKEKYGEVTISIDIGVNRETARRLVEAGATKLVSGSGIFGATDPIEEIKFYQNL